MKKLLLIGAGGHCRSVIDIIRMTGGYDIIGLLGLPSEVGSSVDGLPVVGTDEELAENLHLADECLITIGQIGSPKRRLVVWNRLIELNAKPAVIISSMAHVSSKAMVGAGSIIMHHAVVNAGASIGLNSIVNTKALIEHDVRLGDNVHISTGAIVNGDTSIGHNSFVGSGAVLHHGLVLKDETIVPAGQVVSGK